MNLGNNILLIVGKSGSGKSTLAEELSKDFNLNILESYTTRFPRYDGERGHIFISNREFLQKETSDIIAYTYFNNNHYFATVEQLENNDIYVIDSDGIECLLDEYKGDKGLILVYLDVPVYKRLYRMLKRGDSLFKAFDRVVNDRKKFKPIDNLEMDKVFRFKKIIHLGDNTISLNICKILQSVHEMNNLQ